jgi:hypothetical protein
MDLAQRFMMRYLKGHAAINLVEANMKPVVVPIDGVLDLHTFSPGDLKDLMQDYIDACRDAGILDLRVIHGKGSGVMRKRVQSLLAKDPRVNAFQDAPPEAGGWGATLVKLKSVWCPDRCRPIYRKETLSMLKKIISGGQTGVDRAALDVAMRLGIAHGGWVPKGRLAEDGVVPPHYQLQEMPTDEYQARTEKNVLDSEGTLLISRGSPTGGTDYTRKMALKHGKQLLHIDLSLGQKMSDAGSLIASWVEMNRIETLNVAGPRASNDPSIYIDAVNIMTHALQ